MSINGFDSNITDSRFGVPQGSILRPLLFNLFINDISKIKNVSKILFADDAVMYLSDPNLEVCAAKMNTVVQELSTWLTDNRLVANINKTKVMLFTPRPKNFVPDIYFNGSIIQRVSCMKYLGIYIDDMLTFVPQVNDICTRSSRFQGITYSLAPFIPQSILLNLYRSLIYLIITQNRSHRVSAHPTY